MNPVPYNQLFDIDALKICSGIGCQPIPESGGQYQRNIHLKSAIIDAEKSI